MAQIKGGLFAKGGSGTIIANNGAYFVDLTNATESSGTYTIPSADIENGDFTLQVGDTLIDKDSGSMLKVATLTPDITATLVYEASSGGSQLYQHNIYAWGNKANTGNDRFRISLQIINDNNITFASDTDIAKLITWLSNNGFTSSNSCYHCSGGIYSGNSAVSGTFAVYGIFVANAGKLSFIFAKGTSASTTFEISDSSSSSDNFHTYDTIITL